MDFMPPQVNFFLAVSGSTLPVDITNWLGGAISLRISRYYIKECMFCLFPTNKSDCNLRIPDSLWPYTKNTGHPEPLTT